MRLKAVLGILLPVVGLISWISKEETSCKNSEYILEQIVHMHDNSNSWENSKISVHIQEPRVGNPFRFTKLILDNESDYFMMERIQDDRVVRRVLNSDGESQITLDGSPDFSEEQKEKYGLFTERNAGYKNFYKVLYGFPMSVTKDFWLRVESPKELVYQEFEALKIEMELREPMISKHWAVIVSRDMNKLLALEFIHPDAPEKNQIVKFEGQINIDGISIPRIRNWYNSHSNEYLGSDIIVEELR